MLYFSRGSGICSKYFPELNWTTFQNMHCRISKCTLLCSGFRKRVFLILHAFLILTTYLGFEYLYVTFFQMNRIGQTILVKYVCKLSDWHFSKSTRLHLQHNIFPGKFFNSFWQLSHS